MTDVVESLGASGEIESAGVESARRAFPVWALSTTLCFVYGREINSRGCALFVCSVLCELNTEGTFHTLMFDSQGSRVIVSMSMSQSRVWIYGRGVCDPAWCCGLPALWRGTLPER